MTPRTGPEQRFSKAGKEVIKYIKINQWIVECFSMSEDSFIIALWHVGASCDLECELCELFTTDSKEKAISIWCELVQSTQKLASLQEGRTAC